jgi:hypothetical protein
MNRGGWLPRLSINFKNNPYFDAIEINVRAKSL